MQLLDALLATGRISSLVFLVVVSAFFLYFSWRAKKTGRVPYIRKLAGLDAIEEGVGRATEQGRSVLWTPGLPLTGKLYSADGPMYMAGVTILHHVAKLCAKNRTKLIAAVGHSELLTIVEDAMRLGYHAGGRPEEFRAENIHYLPEYSYTVGVVGLMVREKVATNIFVGSFYSEAIQLFETGNALGCFQIAGTAQTPQLPWCVVCCDFTLIGEELMAAAAYLSKDPVSLGGILGEDAGKIMVLAISIVGIAFVSIGVRWIISLLSL